MSSAAPTNLTSTAPPTVAPIRDVPWPAAFDVAAWIRLGASTDPALVFESGRVVTYGALAAAAQARRAAAGPSAKRLVALVADSSPEALTDYLAALACGDAVVLLPPDQPGLRDKVLSAFDPNEIAERGPGGWQRETRHDRALDLHPELALMLSTSGSTGEAKFVRLSFGNLLANASSIAEYLGLDASERGLMNLPLHYSYGVSIVHSHLSVGARVLVSDRSVTDEALWSFFSAQGGTSVPGVPHTYQLLEASGFLDRAPPTLRTMTQAGGRLGALLAQRVAQWAQGRGVRFFIMYGQTEAAPRIAYVPPELASRHADCIGRAIPGGVLRVVDEHGQPIETPGVEGELQYSGPNVMMGYAVEAADLARPPGPPTLSTGDLAVIDGSGLFRITGRRSRFLKLFGLRLSIDELERRLETQGVVAACGGNDEFLGVLVAGADRDAVALRRQVAHDLGLPEAVVVVLPCAELPRLASGKVDHRQAHALLLAEYQRLRTALPDAAAGPAGRSAADRVRAAFEEAFPGVPVEADDSFSGLGGDSLRYVSVAVALERLVPDLPRRWENLPLQELQALALRAVSAEPQRVARMDTSVVLRALAVLLVVLDHSGWAALAGGAALLLAVAGANFMRFQAGHLARGEWRPVAAGFLWNVLVPYWIVAGAYGLLRGGVNVPDLLLVGNYFVRAEQGSSGFETWFIQVLAQSMLLLGLLALVPAVRRAMADQPFGYALGVLALGLAARLVEPLWWPQLEANGGREGPWQFWEFALGLAIFAASTVRQRALVTALVLALPITLYPDDLPRATILTAGCLLLLWREHLAVPRIATGTLRALAAASLFIYLLHSRAPVHSPTADWPVDLIRVGAGVLLGLIGWQLYERARRGMRYLADRRERAKASSAFR
jgi:acyl-CoA synthetase (AMP-forming)/AMP-acid ligase II